MVRTSLVLQSHVQRTAGGGKRQRKSRSRGKDHEGKGGPLYLFSKEGSSRRRPISKAPWEIDKGNGWDRKPRGKKSFEGGTTEGRRGGIIVPLNEFFN